MRIELPYMPSVNSPLELGDWPYTVQPDTIRARTKFVGTPIAKCRPRFTRTGRVYTTGKTADYEKAIRSLLLASVGFGNVDKDSSFALRCVFYRPNRQRIDCDNMIKAVSDAATGVVWADDSQVMEVVGRTFLASETPHVEILIHTVPDPSPKPKCEVCGKPTNYYKSSPARFCSSECAYSSRRVEWNCPECNGVFSIQKSALRKGKLFCSRKCSIANAKRTKTGLCRPRPAKKLCQSCGGKISKNTYAMCRACHLKKMPLRESNLSIVKPADDLPPKRPPGMTVIIEECNA